MSDVFIAFLVLASFMALVMATTMILERVSREIEAQYSGWQRVVLYIGSVLIAMSGVALSSLVIVNFLEITTVLFILISLLVVAGMAGVGLMPDTVRGEAKKS